MKIRAATKSDVPEIFNLAKRYELDYAGMAEDSFLVAEEKGRVVGIGALKRHEDCIELCSLGVDENYRRCGIGKRLVFALLERAEGDVYLATIIPEFFEKLGFKRADRIPESMMRKSDWCRDCRRDLCTIMVRESW